MVMCGSGGHGDSHKGEAIASEEAIDVGNKTCPVTGEQIKEDLKATYEYKGKVYNFCCAGCIDEFNKYPEKYIKKIEAQAKKEAAEHQGHAH